MSEERKREWLSVRRWLATVTIVIAAGIIGLMVAEHEDEPSYAGRSADVWLRDLAHAPAGADLESEFKSASSAFEQMGTNGVSFLLKSIQRQDSAMAELYYRVFKSLPNSIRRQLPRPAEATVQGNYAAELLCRILNPDPEGTFPSLVKTLSSNSPESRFYAARTIREYVKKYPRLEVARYRTDIVRSLIDTNVVVRLFLVDAFAEVGLSGPELLAALQPALTNSQFAIRTYAETILKKLPNDTRPQQPVPRSSKSQRDSGELFPP
jgi:hypothetical protein